MSKRQVSDMLLLWSVGKKLPHSRFSYLDERISNSGNSPVAPPAESVPAREAHLLPLTGPARETD